MIRLKDLLLEDVGPVRDKFDSKYNYQVRNDIWHTQRKGSTSWISLKNNPVAINKLDKSYPNDRNKISKPSSPASANISSIFSTNRSTFPIKNKIEGDKFRNWVNNTYPEYAKEIDLDPEGKYDNSYIKKAWSKYGEEYTKLKDDSSGPDLSWINSIPEQVQNQIKYLRNIKYNKEYTILDDFNGVVYAINSDSTLHNKYNVITGKMRGDVNKKLALLDWINTVWNKGPFDAYKEKGYDLQAANDYILNCYLEYLQDLKVTPAGIMKAIGGIWGKATNLVLTLTQDVVYGSRFKAFENLAGRKIPYGFHGTKAKDRLAVLDAPSKCEKRKMSYGCINFNDADVKDVYNFMSDGQLSFWLPERKGILKLPKKETPLQNMGRRAQERPFSPITKL